VSRAWRLQSICASKDKRANELAAMSCVTALSSKSPRKDGSRSNLPPTTAAFNVDPQLSAYDDIVQPRTLSPANYEREHNFRTYHQKFSKILTNRQNRNVAAEVAVVKHIVDNSMHRVEHKLSLAQKIDPTLHGVGSNGGHIARMIGARGPLNGNTPVKLRKSEQTSPINLVKSIQYSLDESKTRLIRHGPDNKWQDDFIHEGSLSPELIFYNPIPSTTVGKHRRNSKLAVEVEVSKILTNRGGVQSLPDPTRGSHSGSRGRSTAGNFSPVNTQRRGDGGSINDFSDSPEQQKVYEFPSLNAPVSSPSSLFGNSNPDTRPNTTGSMTTKKRIGLTSSSTATSAQPNLFARVIDGSDKYDSMGVSHNNRALKKWGVDAYKPKYINSEGEFDPRMTPSTKAAYVLGATGPRVAGKGADAPKPSSASSGPSRNGDLHENSFFSTSASSWSTNDQRSPDLSAEYFTGLMRQQHESEGSDAQTSKWGMIVDSDSTSHDACGYQTRYNPQQYVSTHRNSAISVNSDVAEVVDINFRSYSAGAKYKDIDANSSGTSNDRIFENVVDTALIQRMGATLLKLTTRVVLLGSKFGLDDCRFLVNRLMSSMVSPSTPGQHTLVNTTLLPQMCYVGLLMGVSPTLENMLQLFSRQAEAVVHFIQTVRRVWTFKAVVCVILPTF
jgi:hypothetical protein